MGPETAPSFVRLLNRSARGGSIPIAVLMPILLLVPLAPFIAQQGPPAPHALAGPFAGGTMTPPQAHLGPYPLVNGTHVDLATLMPYYQEREHVLERAILGSGTPSIPRPIPAPTSRVPAPSTGGGNGTLTGHVTDSRTGNPIAGASVTLTELTSSCGGVCANTTTDPTGAFALTGAAGPGVLSVSLAHYLANDSFWTVSSGSTTSVGTISLEHDAIVYGRLLGSDPTHEPAAGINVTSSDRSYSTQGGSNATNASGAFTVEVPPLPDILTFAPPEPPAFPISPYLPNQSFVDPAAGAAVDLGNVYLPRGTELNVHLIDGSSGVPIQNASADIAACESDASACPYPVTGSNASVWAVPGPTVLRSIVLGYVQNTTPIGVVPVEAPGTVLNISVQLVPDAVIVFSTNLTGGNVPSQAWNSTYGAVVFCSLDSLLTGFIDNSSTGISGDLCSPLPAQPPSDPYQDFVADQVLLAPPVRTEMHFMSHFVTGNAGYELPAFSNDTFLNTTPGEVVDLGVIDLTPGGWIGGHVVVHGSASAPPNGFTVRACSTDETGACGVPRKGGVACNGSTSDPTAFCASATSGPLELDVLGPGIGPNRTWAELPYLCCNRLGASTPALDLVNTTRAHVREIDVSAVGQAYVHGWVLRGLAGGGTTAAAAASVQLCAVGPYAAANGCLSTVTNGSGGFGLPVDSGWYMVQAALTGAGQNRTWVDATANNSTGYIVLQPFATAYGTAVTPAGVPIAGATVQICPASEPGVCEPFGSGSTTTGGLFYGSHAGAPFPGNAFQFFVSEPGYSSGSAWGNLTGGGLLALGQVVLEPTGAAGSPVLPAGAPAPSLTSWVDGFAVDARSGAALLGYSITACPLLGTAGCVNFPNSPTVDGGEFNGSIPDGPTWVNVSQGGFEPASVFLNLSGPPVHLGAIELTPFPRVTGRVLFGPWENLTLLDGLGPASVTVAVCDLVSGLCGIGSTPNAAGFFNVSAPIGSYDELLLTPLAAATRDYAPTAGMSSYVSYLAVNASGVALNASPGAAPVLTLYTGLTGRVGDASTWNAALRASVAPLRYGMITLWAYGAPLAGGNTTGDGTYTFFAPPGETVEISASGSAFGKVTLTTTAPLDSGIHAVADLNAPHFGWVELRVLSTGGGAGIAGAIVTASAPDPANRTVVQTAGLTDASGFINLTAPVGASVTVNASSPGFAARTEGVAVGESSTTLATALDLTGGPNGLWVASQEVSTYGVPPRVTVRDHYSHAPIPGATAGLYDAFGQPVGNSVPTNGLGQFLVASIPIPGGGFAIEMPGYSPNGSVLPASSGTYRYSTIDLLGNGVIAGTVVDGATGAPLGQVQVGGCSGSAPVVCETTQSNASGAYWLSLPAGYATLTYTAPGFVANQSILEAVTSDGFVEVAPIPLWQSDLVIGRVIGLPTGGPLPTAQVSLCPLDQLFQAYCNTPVPVNALGQFFLEVPSGGWTLNVTAPGYQPSSFELSTGVGETIEIGDIALVENGTLVGEVLASDTASPLANVTVTACSSAASGCVVNFTGPTGAYSVNLVPGPATVTFSTLDYEPFVLRTVVGSAETLTLPTVTLAYLGPGDSFLVTGRITALNASGRPLNGAIVAAFLDGNQIASTATGGQGDYALALPWGSYTLAISAPGFAVDRLPLTVVGPTAGVDAALVPFDWPVYGLVTDGVTHRPAADIRLELNGAVLGASGPAGNFSVNLPNGSFAIELVPGPQATPAFLNSSERIVVNGAPVRAAPVIPVRTAGVELTVVAARDGHGVPDALVILSGQLLLGTDSQANLSTDANGSLSLELPLGRYAVTASASGYAANGTSFNLTGASVVLRIALPGGPPGGATLLGEAIVPAAAIGVIAVAGIALLILFRRRRAPPGPWPEAASVVDETTPVESAAPRTAWDDLAERYAQREAERNAGRAADGTHDDADPDES